MTARGQRMLEDLRIRNYAPTTIACYIRAVAELARYFKKPPDQLGSEEIRSWQLLVLNQRRVKLSSYIQSVCELCFFYQKLGRQNKLHYCCTVISVPACVVKPLYIAMVGWSPLASEGGTTTLN